MLTSADCYPLTLSRAIADFPIGNQPLRWHQQQCRPEHPRHPHAWLDPSEWRSWLDSGQSTLIAACGTVLAWQGAAPQEVDGFRAARSFLIRYPWDLLRANEQCLEALEAEIAGELHPLAVIDGSLRLGIGSRVLPGVVIEGQVVIGRNCKIGPNCHLRGNTSIGDGCLIGQAVEVKNSIILARSAIAHLSFVGDSILGEDVNLGAGTITSNYRHDAQNHRSLVGGELVDTGRLKFGSVIGDGVRTGIHTSILPGRKLWPGVTTRPGSVVETDLISRSR